MAQNNNVIAVLLLGMDGTGKLFEPFIAQLPPHVRPLIVKYPNHVPLCYDELVRRVASELPRTGAYVIIAESYSGPMALRLGLQPIGDLRAVVLVASFASRPLGRLGSWVSRLPLSAFFRMRPPLWLLRWLLMEDATSSEMVSLVRDTISEVSPEVLAARLKEALTVNFDNATEACRVRLVIVTAERDRLLAARVKWALVGTSQNIEACAVSAPHLLLQCAPQPGVEIMARLGLFDQPASTNSEVPVGA